MPDTDHDWASLVALVAMNYQFVGDVTAGTILAVIGAAWEG